MSIAEFISTAPQRQAVAPRPTPTLVKFPAVEPGQLWLIEAPVDAQPSTAVRHALDSVNVVMYDRALAGALSGALPLGTYAEAAADGLADPSAARCVGFTVDGWSVVRLMAAGLPQRQRTGSVRALAAALIAAKAPGDLAVQIFAGTDGICEHEETTL